MIRNYTPHAITVVDKDHETIATFPPSGEVARVAVTRACVDVIDGIPVYEVFYGAPSPLPAPQEGTYYLVSLLYKTACPQRTDLLSPGELVRDRDGVVIGCHGLNR